MSKFSEDAAEAIFKWAHKEKHHAIWQVEEYKRRIQEAQSTIKMMDAILEGL